MFTQLFIALAALMSLNFVSAWHLTNEHVDGIYGIDKDENIHLIMEANHTAVEEIRSKRSSMGSWLSSDRSSRNSHWKRQGLPGGTVQCHAPYVAQRDLASCLIQAEAYCGVGTIGTGAKLTDYTAYAWKSNEVFLFICDWNYHWFYTGSTTCWNAEVAALITLVENHCGYGSGNTAVQAGSYKINDWGIEMGYNQLGLDGCPNLKGNNDGTKSNAPPDYVAQALPSGAPAGSSYSGPVIPTPAASGVAVDGPTIGVSQPVPAPSGSGGALPGGSGSVLPAPSATPPPASLPVASASFVGGGSSFVGGGGVSSIAIGYY